MSPLSAFGLPVGINNSHERFYSGSLDIKFLLYQTTSTNSSESLIVSQPTLMHFLTYKQRPSSMQPIFSYISPPKLLKHTQK